MSDSLLNFTEILRRIGVLNRTEVDLSSTVRMVVAASDLSHLAPAIPVPVGGFGVSLAQVGGSFQGIAVKALAPGGIFPVASNSDLTNLFSFWVSSAIDFAGAPGAVAMNSLAAGLPISTVVTSHTQVADASPTNAPFGRGVGLQTFDAPILVKAGDFFHVQTETTGLSLTLSMIFQEIPAASRLPDTV